MRFQLKNNVMDHISQPKKKARIRLYQKTPYIFHNFDGLTRPA